MSQERTNVSENDEMNTGDVPHRTEEREWRPGELAEVIKTRGSGRGQRVKILDAWWGKDTGHRVCKVVDETTSREYIVFGDVLKEFAPPAPAPQQR